MDQDSSCPLALENTILPTGHTYLTLGVPGYEDIFTPLAPGSTLDERLPQIRFSQISGSELTLAYVFVPRVFDQAQMAQLREHLGIE